VTPPEIRSVSLTPTDNPAAYLTLVRILFSPPEDERRGEVRR
jgi:hypothetical protein